MGTGDYYRHILHRGVIQEEGMRVGTPIPSFRHWIVENCTARPKTESDGSGISALPDRYDRPSHFEE